MSRNASSSIFEFSEQLRSLRNHLETANEKLVLVESCTAGIVSGLLGQIPGISHFLCGSFVIYRNDSKHQWLGIDQELLNDPKIGPVSAQVTESLAIAALKRTPEATISAAITGHLGPNSPGDLDGRAYTCIVRSGDTKPAPAIEHQLLSLTPSDSEDWQGRQRRQLEAARLLYDAIIRSFG